MESCRTSVHLVANTLDGQALLTLNTNVVPKVVCEYTSFIELSCLQALREIATITNIETSLKDAVACVQAQLTIVGKLLKTVEVFV